MPIIELLMRIRGSLYCIGRQDEEEEKEGSRGGGGGGPAVAAIAWKEEEEKQEDYKGMQTATDLFVSTWLFDF